MNLLSLEKKYKRSLLVTKSLYFAIVYLRTTAHPPLSWKITAHPSRNIVATPMFFATDMKARCRHVSL